jgi:integrase-like protein
LISLLAINGLRISEALGADIDAHGLERGHRTLTVLRKGGKIVTIPLAPRTARAIDLAVGGRVDGPIFLADGQRMDRHAAGRIVRRIAKRGGIDKKIGPHTLRHAFITAALEPASHCATCKKPPHTPTREPPCATTAPASPSTGTPPTSSPHSSPAPPDNANKSPPRLRPAQTAMRIEPSIGAQIDLRARRACESIVDTLGLDQTTGMPRSGRSEGCPGALCSPFTRGAARYPSCVPLAWSGGGSVRGRARPWVSLASRNRSSWRAARGVCQKHWPAERRCRRRCPMTSGAAEPVSVLRRGWCARWLPRVGGRAGAGVSRRGGRRRAPG